MWLDRLVEWQAQGIPCAIVTIIDAKGFTPRKTGAKMVVTEDGRSAGSVGGGTSEQQCIELAAKAIAHRTCLMQRFVSSVEGGGMDGRGSSPGGLRGDHDGLYRTDCSRA